MLKKVNFESNIYEPEIKRTCNCFSCYGCGHTRKCYYTWTSFRCSNYDCKNYVCSNCYNIEKKQCKYCLRQ